MGEVKVDTIESLQDLAIRIQGLKRGNESLSSEVLYAVDWYKWRKHLDERGFAPNDPHGWIGRADMNVTVSVDAAIRLIDELYPDALHELTESALSIYSQTNPMRSTKFKDAFAPLLCVSLLSYHAEQKGLSDD